MLGRHWPVAYLHRESPPNTTDHYVNGDRRDRELLLESGSGESNKSTQTLLNNRSGKVERILRSRGENRSSALNFTTDSRSTGSEIFKLANFVDRRDAEALESGKNETKSDNDWGTTFVRLPTITPNKTREDESKFEEYFEIVDV